MRRREYLLGGSVVAAGLLGGCSGVSDSLDSGAESAGDSPDNGEGSDDESPDCAATVTIESVGMEPALPKGAEVCVVEYDSYEPVDDPEETGVITSEVGDDIGYERFGGTGDIIRYYPDGDEAGTPVIARAIAWDNGSYVTKGDNSDEPYPWDAPVESVIGVVDSIR